MGLSVGVGMALSARLESRSYDTYVLLGDGELQEGQNWEAAMAAARFGLDNLIAVVDWNGVQLDGRVDDIMPLGDLRRKFEAFGWRVAECDGHSIREIVAAVDALKQAGGMPCALLARTVKGKGVSFMEGKNAWHGKAIEDADFAVAIDELGRGCR